MAVRQGLISVLVYVATAPVFHTEARSASAPPLQPNEQIIKTKDGCGFVVDNSKPSASFEKEAKSKLTWGGPCVAGLAMGEGWVSEGDYRYADIPPIRGWAWYGRIFGSIGSQDSSSFVWDGKYVRYTTLSTTAPVWSKQHNERSSVSDGDTLVMTNTRGCILESKTLPECKQENKFEIPGVTVLDLKSKKSAHYNCPDLRSTQGCETLWAEHAGPVIGRIKVFLAENEPKVEARKREIAPLIVSWRPAPNAKRQDEARHAAQRTAQLAERQQREAKHAATLESMKRETERLQRETDALRAESAEAERKAKEERARDRRETLSLLGNAAVAAAGGKNSAERKQLALQSISESANGSGAHGTITVDTGNTPAEYIQLSPPGSARSRNECVRFDWLNSPPSFPTAFAKLGYPKGPANYGDIQDPRRYGTDASSGRAEQRILAVKNICTEDLIIVVSACAEHSMLKPGFSYEYPTGGVAVPKRDREKYRYDWSTGTFLSTHIGGIYAQHFPAVPDWGYRAVTAELKIHPELDRAALRKVKKVFYGAWPRSELTTEPAIDGVWGSIGWGPRKPNPLTANGMVLDRRRVAIAALAMDVLAWSQERRRNNTDPVGFTYSMDGMGVEYPSMPSPSVMRRGVKTCDAYTADQAWNSVK